MWKHTKEAEMSQSNNHQKGIVISTFSVYEQKFCKRILRIHRNLRLGGKSNHNKTRTEKVKSWGFLFTGEDLGKFFMAKHFLQGGQDREYALN